MTDINKNNSGLDSFLTDADEVKEEELEKYIKPNIETKLNVRKRRKCREIIQEIKMFGVSQREILYLINLLALELENIDVMKALTKVIGEKREEIPLDKIETSEKKIIVPK